MLRKQLFITAHCIGDTSFYKKYKNACQNQWRPYTEAKQELEKQLPHMIQYVYEQVPYYRQLFKTLKLQPRDIRSIEDLEKLPILTKEIIKANWEAFTPANLSSQKFDWAATSGSTGTPFKYRISRYDRFYGAALMYRNWGYGGYNLGDPMVFLAGAALDTGSKPFLENKVHELARNIRRCSSFGMGEAEMRRYVDIMNSFRPRFLRGYASSIFFFARWLKENDYPVPALDAVFTTSEMLFPHMRKTIGEAFGCDVYNGYGASDSGAGASECSEHNGLHLVTERVIMEVVDNNNRQILEGDGEIIATNLHNYALPFIRYATGDAGKIVTDKCPCGRDSPLLKELLGRQSEMLITPDGKYVFGQFIDFFSHRFPQVKEFQVVQKEIDKLTFNIVRESNFDEKVLDEMRSLLESQGWGWTAEFRLVDQIDRSRSGKYKYIINEVENA